MCTRKTDHCMAAQADLSLRLEQMSENAFSHIAAPNLHIYIAALKLSRAMTGKKRKERKIINQKKISVLNTSLSKLHTSIIQIPKMGQKCLL